MMGVKFGNSQMESAARYLSRRADAEGIPFSQLTITEDTFIGDDGLKEIGGVLLLIGYGWIDFDPDEPQECFRPSSEFIEKMSGAVNA